MCTCEAFRSPRTYWVAASTSSLTGRLVIWQAIKCSWGRHQAKTGTAGVAAQMGMQSAVPGMQYVSGGPMGMQPLPGFGPSVVPHQQAFQGHMLQPAFAPGQLSYQVRALCHFCYMQQVSLLWSGIHSKPNCYRLLLYLGLLGAVWCARQNAGQPVQTYGIVTCPLFHLLHQY